MYFDKENMKKSVKDLKSDIDVGELTATAWLWVITGGLLGLAASCVRVTKKVTQPILAKLGKNRIGENK